jgi:hypothetical protein
LETFYGLKNIQNYICRDKHNFLDSIDKLEFSIVVLWNFTEYITDLNNIQLAYESFKPKYLFLEDEKILEPLCKSEIDLPSFIDNSLKNYLPKNNIKNIELHRSYKTMIKIEMNNE